jgi:hypothetical protein
MYDTLGSKAAAGGNGGGVSLSQLGSAPVGQGVRARGLHRGQPSAERKVGGGERLVKQEASDELIWERPGSSSTLGWEARRLMQTLTDGGRSGVANGGVDGAFR